MDTKYIIDTSVVVKWIAPENEKNLKEAAGILRKAIDEAIHLVVPDLLLAEFANVLYAGRKFSNTKIHYALERLSNVPIRIVPITPKLIRESTNLATQYKQTIYDSIYLALAKYENTKVITADNKLAEVSKYTLPLWEFHK